MSKLQWSDLKDNMGIRKTSARSSLNARLTQASLESAKGISTAAAVATSFGTVVASGGTQSNLSIYGTNYRVHTFATSANLVVTTGGNVDLLVVGAGASARGWIGALNYGSSGGGGGGGVLLYGAYEQSRAGGGPIYLDGANTYTITIGAGGPGTANNYVSAPQLGRDGGNTIFAGGVLNLIAYGGTIGPAIVANDGVRGGNAAMLPFVSNQGYRGGFRGTILTTGVGSGGGGGAGGAGESGANYPQHVGGTWNGGSGIESTISGTWSGYGGGGGGGVYNWSAVGTFYRGKGGFGGGGDAGGNAFIIANAGNVNTGGGGGGASSRENISMLDRSTAGAGGSGIVIVRYVV